MKETIIWVLMHIVGPITLLVIVLGVFAKVSRVVFGDAHDNALARIGAVVGGSLSKLWHFFFLNADERDRLNTYETTGVDPATHTTEESEDTDTPTETETSVNVPDSVIGLYEKAFNN